jgi:ATP-binding cassette subfamily F protein uup
MSLLTLVDATLAYGLQPLLDGAALTVNGGERIGLIGRNGSGKSSLLGVLAGSHALDDGVVQRRDGLRIAHVEQEPVLPERVTLHAALVARGRFDAIDDERERWRLEARLVEYLHRFDVDPAAVAGQLSGGMRKRAALALAFAQHADLLLLDEPTNHLDIDGIVVLEELLQDGPTSIAITHDRSFLDRVVTRIVELDRGRLRSYPGNFAAYAQRKADELADEATANRRFDKFWAQEEAWIRRGIEARRTRNEGRVQRLIELREERARRRERPGDLRLGIDAGERSGRLVAELQQVGKRYGDRTIVAGLDLTVLRGDRLALVGPNGAGKTTLLRLIVGDLAPDSGSVRLGTNLQIAYFDQLRAQLDPDASVADTVNPGADWVETGGERRHVVSYLGDFLFAPQRLASPVRMLSGGERNRLLLARLFAKPANVLVLDEPTNDLDLESLELLEDTLQRYPGTLLLVSHDRRFLDNIVTQTLAPLGDGRWREYVGGYSDWLAQRPAPRMEASRGTSESPKPGSAGATGNTDAARAPPKPSKMSYKETRELDELPARIEALETEQRLLVARLSEPGHHTVGHEQLRTDAARAGEIEHELTAAYERWAELDRKAEAR